MPLKLGATTTVSVLVEIPKGKHWGAAEFEVPECAADTTFLVQGLYVAPTIDWTPSFDTLKYPRWQASIQCLQDYSGFSLECALRVVSEGFREASASLPAGQTPMTFGGLRVSIALLNNVTAPLQLRFIVHVTGLCGQPYVGKSKTGPKLSSG